MLKNLYNHFVEKICLTDRKIRNEVTLRLKNNVFCSYKKSPCLAYIFLKFLFFQLLGSGTNNKVTVLMNKLSKARTAVVGRKGRNNKIEKKYMMVQGNDTVNKYSKC